MKPLSIILLFLLWLVAPTSAQTFDAPPQPQPQVMQAGYVTISWYPGKLKGYSQAETQRIIVEACQQWQSVSGVRFGTLAAGQATQITLYPYARQRIWLQEAVEESNRQRSELLEKTKDRYTSKNAEKDWNQFYEANPEVKRVGD